jgi:hypothetical protein
MPMVLSQINNDWNKHRECLIFVCFEDVKEIIILKEAHCSISNLQVDTSNALYYSFEESKN